jgi:hypothetical protein
MFGLPFACEFIEGSAGFEMDRGRAAEALPAPYTRVDVFRIKLDQARSPARFLRRNGRRGGASKGIQNHGITVAAVTDRIGDERHGL